MSVRQLLDDAVRLATEYSWVFQVFFVVLVTLIAGALARQVIKRIAKKSAATGTIIDDALFGALLGPTRGIIWIIGIAFAAKLVGVRTEAAIFDAVGPLRAIGVIAMFTWFLVRLIRLYQELYVARQLRAGETIDRTFVDAVGKLMRAAVFITAVLMALQTLGFNIAGLLAFGGVGGIAIGFAARDLVANLFGGLTIYMDHPFAVGDWIRSPDREIEGTVEDIGWRRTAIRTFDKRVLYVPNSLFSTISVENPSRMSHRRIRETIGVRYDDVQRIPRILEDIRALLATDTDIDQSQTLMVNVNEFAESSVNFFIYTFTRTTVWTEYHAIKERIMLEIASIIARHGGEIAFPTRTLHVPEDIRLADTPATGP